MAQDPPDFSLDVVVVGGCGHVGLPLAIAFAARGLEVGDLRHQRRRRRPGQQRRAAVPRGRRAARCCSRRWPTAGCAPRPTPRSSREPRPSSWSSARRSTSTSTPTRTRSPQALRGQRRRTSATASSLVLRSTVYPGVTALRRAAGRRARARRRRRLLPRADRRGQGDGGALRAAADRLRPHRTRPATGPRRCSGTSPTRIVELEPEEAELAKLFTNTWRYIKFAAANQFYMMANDHGLDFERIRAALAHDYPRAADMPGAGFAAGPCLFKDTMQLAAFSDNSFALGHAAMLVNEGLPLYLVSQLEQQHDLADMTRRHPRDGVQGRERRHPLEPVLQAQADPGVPGRRGALHRPVRHRRPDSLLPLDEVARARRPADHRRRRTGVYRDLDDRHARSSTSGTCSGEGATV